MDESFNIKVKICLVGDAGVGKTSLIRRYVLDIFNDQYLTTLGAKVSKKRVIITKDDQKYAVTLSIWDILGQESFRNIQTMAFKGSKGALLVCDLTRKQSLENIKNWYNRIKEVTGDIPFILLANKADLKDQYNYSENDINEFASNLNIPYLFTSAKSGENVIKTFFKISDLITSKIIDK